MAMGPSPGITRDHRLVEISAGIGWRRDRAFTLRETVDGATRINSSTGRGSYASLTAEAMKPTRRAFSNAKPDSSLAAWGVAAPQIGSRWTCRFLWVPASTLVQAAWVIVMQTRPFFIRGSDAVLATEREHERTHSHIQGRQQARKLPTFRARG